MKRDNSLILLTRHNSLSQMALGMRNRHLNPFMGFQSFKAQT